MMFRRLGENCWDGSWSVSPVVENHCSNAMRSNVWMSESVCVLRLKSARLSMNSRRHMTRRCARHRRILSRSSCGQVHDGQGLFPLSNLLSWLFVGRMSNTSLVKCVRRLSIFPSARRWASQLMLAVECSVHEYFLVMYSFRVGAVAWYRKYSE
jgi:hypothetical protein